MLASRRRIGVAAGFGLLLILIVVNAFVTSRRIGDQTGIEFWVSHTHQVLLELKQTELMVLEAESGDRAYLYTGAAQYLQSFHSAADGIDGQIAKVAQLTSDNPRQQAAIPELRSLINARVAEMNQTIALYQASEPNEARLEILADTSQHTIDRIHQTIAGMENEELRLEAIRTAAYRRGTRAAIESVYLASLLAGIGLVLLGFYILREAELRERHAQELLAREKWFRITLTSIGDAVIATDRQGAVTFLNPVAEALTGMALAQARGKDIQEVFPIFNEHTQARAENPVRKVIESGVTVALANHTVLRRQDGSEVPIEDSAAPIRGEDGALLGVILVFRDVTGERRARALMSQTEKLAAAARLAATMAHEINNPLQAVGSLVFLAMAAPGAPPEMIEKLDQADKELKRVAHITQQTLGFYRDAPATEDVSLAALAESVIAIYGNRLRAKGVSIDRRYSECPPVRGASGELKQVISNLIANAADAVGNQGTICITLRPRQLDGAAMVQMLIEDDGPGIAPAHLGKIFEPFFTTKQDVGTGLGLWLSKEIVERHQGSVEVAASENGFPGAAFSVLLPCAGPSPGQLAD